MTEISNISYATLLNIDLNLPDKLLDYIIRFINDENNNNIDSNDSNDSNDTNNVELNASRALAERNTSDYIFNVFACFNKLVNKTQNIEEIETFTQAIVSIFYTLSNQEFDKISLVVYMVEQITSSSQYSRIRIKALVVLLNHIMETDAKLIILKALLTYAKENNKASLISHFHTRIEEWMIDWKLSLLQSRNLYQKISELLAIDGLTSIALMYLIKFFKTYGIESYPPDVEEIAIQAILQAIKSPVSAFTDRTALLENFLSKKNDKSDLGKLIQVLETICTGQLIGLSRLENQFQDLIQRYSIDISIIKYNIRMMTLCALGCEKTNLSYTEIAEALDVPMNDVEDWVVDAVGQNLLCAQMDQTINNVCVSQSAHRSFGPLQWKLLQEKLRNVRTKVSSVLDAVNKHSN